jgi:hypothetical protein
MKKEQSKTLEARLGFDDPDLKTSKHDEIMLWLDENIRKYPYELLGKSKEWEQKEFSLDHNNFNELNRYLTDSIFWPEKPELNVISVTWETPIAKKNGGSDYIVGFVDLMLTIKEPRLFLGKELEIFYTEENYFFEVKTKIKSIGELIRQIRLYQHYKRGEYFVVSPEINIQQILSSQGIKHILYTHDRFIPDEAILPDGTKIIIPPK